MSENYQNITIITLLQDLTKGGKYLDELKEAALALLKQEEIFREELNEYNLAAKERRQNMLEEYDQTEEEYDQTEEEYRKNMLEEYDRAVEERRKNMLEEYDQTEEEYRKNMAKIRLFEMGIKIINNDIYKAAETELPILKEMQNKAIERENLEARVQQDEKIEELNKKVKDQEAKIRGQEAKITELEATLAERDECGRILTHHLVSLNTTLVDEDKTVDNLLNTIQDKNTEIAELKNELNAMQQNNAEPQRDVANRHNLGEPKCCCIVM